jgi:hypothetical protein
MNCCRSYVNNDDFHFAISRESWWAAEFKLALSVVATMHMDQKVCILTFLCCPNSRLYRREHVLSTNNETLYSSTGTITAQLSVMPSHGYLIQQSIIIRGTICSIIRALANRNVSCNVFVWLQCRSCRTDKHSRLCLLYCNSLEPSSSWEVTSYSATEKFPSILYCLHNSSAVVPIMGQINRA